MAAIGVWPNAPRGVIPISRSPSPDSLSRNNQRKQDDVPTPCPILVLDPDIFHEIYQFMSPLDLICWARSCHLFQGSVASYYRVGLGRLYGRFFRNQNEISAFRRLQRDYGAFVSGSSGIQFLDNICYPDSDLDVYVEKCNADPIGKWLINIGYEYAPRRNQNSTFDGSRDERPEEYDFLIHGNGVMDVYEFHRNGKKVQLITAVGTPLVIILGFHSTPPMNIITYNHAYSFYPKATFEERRGLIVMTGGDRHEIGRQKYRDRGWTLTARTEYTDPKSDFCPGVRWLGDKKCLTVSLPPIESRDTGLRELSKAPSTVPTILYSSWSVWGTTGPLFQSAGYEPGSVQFARTAITLGSSSYCCPTYSMRGAFTTDAFLKLQKISGCSWDELYRIVAPMFLAKQSSVSGQDVDQTIKWFRKPQNLTLITSVLDALASSR